MMTEEKNKPQIDCLMAEGHDEKEQKSVLPQHFMIKSQTMQIAGAAQHSLKWQLTVSTRVPTSWNLSQTVRW